jgi:hypothetical protein
MNDLLREELLNVRRERDAAFDRLMQLLNRPEAVMGPSVEAPEEAGEKPPETEEDAIDREQTLLDQLHKQSEEELRRYAGDHGVPVEALHDV